MLWLRPTFAATYPLLAGRLAAESRQPTLFSHSPQLLDQFAQLSVATLSVTGVTAAPDVADTTRPFLERATARLANGRRASSPRSPLGGAHSARWV
jgi:hypothetical protein